MNKKSVLEFIVIGTFCLVLVWSLGVLLMVEPVLCLLADEITRAMTTMAIAAIIGLCAIVYLGIWIDHLDLIKRFPDPKKKRK